MSFTSSLPANLPKYGVPPTWDFAKGREQYIRTAYDADHATGIDRHIKILPSIDFATGLETFAILLSQLDKATAIERLIREMTARDLLRTVEKFLIRLSSTDIIRGMEPGFVSLAQKYFDLQTGQVTTRPTPQSVFIGIGGVGGCVYVDDVTLCYKRLGDMLDWETLRDLLIAFKWVDDKVRVWLDIINKRWNKKLIDIINRELPG